MLRWTDIQGLGGGCMFGSGWIRSGRLVIVIQNWMVLCFFLFQGFRARMFSDTSLELEPEQSDVMSLKNYKKIEAVSSLKNLSRY